MAAVLLCTVHSACTPDLPDPRLHRSQASTHDRLISRVHNPPECATPIQLCIGSWSSGIGSYDVMRTLHTSARPVSRQGTIVFDPRVPATSRVPLRFVRYYDAKIRFRSTKTLCRAGSGVTHSGGLCTLAYMHLTRLIFRLLSAMCLYANPAFIRDFTVPSSESIAD